MLLIERIGILLVLQVRIIAEVLVSFHYLVHEVVVILYQNL